MGKIIALVNQKGGVAKTTTTAQLAWGLKRAGKKVLCLDCDPQGSLTRSMGCSSERAPTVYEWLGCASVAYSFEDTVRNIGGIDLLPADNRLAKAELYLTTVLKREAVLLKALKPLKARYDYILLDSPPSLGLLTINILTAADEVLVPAKPEYLSFEGVELLIKTIKDIKSNCNSKLQINGFLITLYDKRRDVADWVDMLSDVAAKTRSVLYTTRIRNSASVANAPAYASSVSDCAAGSIGAQDYNDFIQEFLNREQDNEKGKEQRGGQPA